MSWGRRPGWGWGSGNGDGSATGRGPGPSQPQPPALQDIAPGEELFVSYGDVYWRARERRKAKP